MSSGYTCPLPIEEQKVITLAHGSGGKQTSHLIEKIFLPAFSNAQLDQLHDGAVLDLPHNQIVFTTDSFVVQPLFFPGGDIGTLAVTGTANDLAMCGARPLFLSCGFIIEEGFLQEDLKRIVDSMRIQAEALSLQIVTGDTKVVERHTGQNIFINTSAIGVKMSGDPIAPNQIQSGDAILLSGDIGRHGVAVMAAREGLEFASPLLSDCAPLVDIVEALLTAGIEVHCLRDITRGGLSTALVELAEGAKMEFIVSEEGIPVSAPVENACEILGIDPLYVANEGRFIAFVPSAQAELALQIMHRFSYSEHAARIGEVIGKTDVAGAKLENPFGIQRYLYKLVGDQLPRIC